MDIDTANLMWSILFGAVGVGFIMYAKKAGKVMPGIAGMGLCIIPYMITSTLWLVIICVLLMAAPFCLRDS